MHGLNERYTWDFFSHNSNSAQLVMQLIHSLLNNLYKMGFFPETDISEMKEWIGEEHDQFHV